MIAETPQAGACGVTDEDSVEIGGDFSRLSRGRLSVA
jgi:hypothetical protein